jgi:hypothetical protein
MKIKLVFFGIKPSGVFKAMGDGRIFNWKKPWEKMSKKKYAGSADRMYNYCDAA